MTENLTKRFVDLGRSGLAPQGNAKLCLDHVERGFDVGTLVIALHEPFGVVAIQVIHLIPKGRARASGLLRVIPLRAVGLERNVGHRMVINDRLHVGVRQIGFVGAHLLHNKVLRGSVNQRFELGRVCAVALSHFNRSDDVGFDAAHDVALDELPFLDQVRIGVLRVHPLDEARSRKPEESTAKSDSIALKGRLLSSISALRKGVKVGFSR